MGCILKPCGPPGKPFSAYSCATNSRLLPRTSVCPGDTLVFDEVSINDRFRFMYTLNFSAPSSTPDSAPPIPTSGKLDFYLLSDVTGSMSSAISSVRTQFLNLVDAFSKLNPDVKFGLGFYRDETELGGDGFENVRAITNNLTSIRVAINRLRATGGGDGPEANLVALYRVATLGRIGWRDDAAKILAYFGDWPGHEPTCVSKLPQLNRTFVANALARRGIKVVAVSFPPPGLSSGEITVFRCPGETPAGPGQAAIITKRTGGALVQAGDQRRVLFSIRRALRGIATNVQVDVDESECTTAILSRHEPALPVNVPPGRTLTVKNILRLKKRVCVSAKKREFSCKYKYGDDVVNVVFKRLRDCP